MRRIRLVFVFLAIAVFVPMGLLVQNALRSVEEERTDRHAAVAERIFDEMERELSELLAQEERRPFEHYRFFHVSADSRGHTVISRSPLSWLPEAPYVVGSFQIDPDQTFHSPLIPRDATLAKAFADWSYSREVDEAVAMLERIARTGVASNESLEVALEPPDKPAAPAAAVVEDRGAEQVASGRGREQEGAFAALRSLNRAANERQQQRLAVRVRSEHDVAVVTARAKPMAPSVGSASLATSLLRLPGRPLDRDAPVTAVYFDVDAAVRDESPVAYPVRVDSVLGHVLGAEHLVLYRDAELEGRRFRQGTVLDFRRLTEWLDQSVLGGSYLSQHAGRDFFMRYGQPPRRTIEDARVYLHRFAQPFDALALRLTLPPLPDVGGTNYLYTIAGLLVLAGGFGLFALYHTVGVTVRYAERRTNFAAAVSHELKTPLTAIRMHGEMLRDGMVPTEEKKSEYYRTITAESERLSRLIGNVLEFSRLEQGAREVNLVSGPIGPVVAEAARNLEAHARDAGFRLEIDVNGDLPSVRFERDAIVQIIYNLVDNAIKYAREAVDRRVRVRCERVGETVKLSVRDWGQGVSSRHLRKIFEAFYRGESELTRTSQGTGIGLALVKGLAERMGAAVVGGNVPDGGFEVSITFRSNADRPGPVGSAQMARMAARRNDGHRRGPR